MAIFRKNSYIAFTNLTSLTAPDTIAALKNGDTLVLEHIFNQHHAKLYLYIVSKTKSHYLAEETVQLSFIKLWNHRKSLNETISVEVQLFRIAKTTFIDLVRNQASQDRLLKKVSAASATVFDNETIEKLDAKDSSLRFYKAIKQLPVVRQKVFTMSRIQGMSYKDIAAELSISIKTVENHISQALKQLRHIFIIFLILTTGW